MGKTSSDVKIENENLFRAIVCAPVGVFFFIMAVNSVMSPGLVLFKVIFVLMAMTFTLGSLGYAAFFTNDYFAEQAQNGD